MMTAEAAYINILNDMHRIRVTKDITLRSLSERLNSASIGHLCMIENGKTDARLTTFLRILDRLDSTLVVVPYNKISDVEGAINNVSK